MVTAGENDPASLPPEERVDQALTQARYGQAGIGSLGIGEWMDSGGGGGGQFVFADLDELDAVRREWESLRDEIADRNDVVATIQILCTPPAGDMMSHQMADAGLTDASAKRNHEDALFAYAEAYVDKLTASRDAMAATEQTNSDRLRGTGTGFGHA